MDHKPFNMEEAREKIRRYSGSSLPDRERTAEEREHLKQQLTLLQEMQQRGELRQFLEEGHTDSDE